MVIVIGDDFEAVFPGSRADAVPQVDEHIPRIQEGGAHPDRFGGLLLEALDLGHSLFLDHYAPDVAEMFVSAGKQ